MTLRIPKAELPAELRESLVRQLGAVPEPVEVSYNNPKVAVSSQEFSAGVATWDAADASLKTFAHMAVAAQVGCSWCLDVNYFLAQNHNLDLAKASQVPRWRESDVFTPLERDVLEYAEAMTSTPTTVSGSATHPTSEYNAGREGTYIITSVLDKFCPGVPDNTANRFSISWISRPTLGISQHPSISTEGGKHAKKDVCEGCCDMPTLAGRSS